VLQLRAYADPGTSAAVAADLDALAGTRHVTLEQRSTGTTALVTADIGNNVADAALETLRRHGVQAEDIVLVRLAEIGTAAGAGEPLALVWADVLGQAQTQARAPARYFVLMGAAGVVGAFAIINDSAVLLVGAMAISPDLLPITAACTGLVMRRLSLAGRGAATLFAGFVVTFIVGAVLTAVLDQLNLLPSGFGLGDIPASQTHVAVSTILIALAAGVAGMLAVETRGSAAVGVAISVTTIPAVAYLAVAVGIGSGRHALSGLAVLGTNVLMMVIGGTLALTLQRVAARRS
jgi:uncharacterized hydrophobic protein (TIGR00271 family)